MKSPATVSPFTARSSQEQKEQWIWWQCQQTAVMPVESHTALEDQTAPEESAAVPALQLPQQEDEKPAEAAPQRQPTRHSQYDAVVRRMQNATRQVRHYTSVK